MDRKMKYRNKKKLTRMRRFERKMHSILQRGCARHGIRMVNNMPRWRQLKKARAKYGCKETI